MFKYASYFEEDVLSKRPYMKKEWCERVVSEKKHVKEQPDGRFRFWGKVPEYGNRTLRVVTLADKTTILTLFLTGILRR